MIHDLLKINTRAEDDNHEVDHAEVDDDDIILSMMKELNMKLAKVIAECDNDDWDKYDDGESD